jgi:hypothetical protein
MPASWIKGTDKQKCDDEKGRLPQSMCINLIHTTLLPSNLNDSQKVSSGALSETCFTVESKTLVVLLHTKPSMYIKPPLQLSPSILLRKSNVSPHTPHTIIISSGESTSVPAAALPINHLVRTINISICEPYLGLLVISSVLTRSYTLPTPSRCSTTQCRLPIAKEPASHDRHEMKSMIREKLTASPPFRKLLH